MRERVRQARQAVRRGGLCLTAGIFWLIPAAGMTLVVGVVVLVPLVAILVLAGVSDAWIRRVWSSARPSPGAWG